MSPPFYNPETPGVFDPRYFHYIGETSPVIEAFIPKPRGQGGTTNQRRLERSTVPDQRLSTILEYGGSTTVDLFGGGGQLEVNRALVARFGSPGDEELFPQSGIDRAAVKDFAVGFGSPVASVVKFLENVPFREVAELSAKALKEKMVSHKDAVAGAVVSSNRSSEHVADHHGGPIHPTAGGFAIAWMADMIKRDGGAAAEAWADLAVVQSMAIATRHIEIGRKLAGPAVMPELDLGDEIAQMTDPKQVCVLLAQALTAKHPTRAERLVVRALQLQASRDDLLTALMEEAVPLNAVDDHFFLYPNFSFMTLDAIGWEFAPWVLRGIVRYLATVPPYYRDKFTNADGSFVDTKAVGRGPSDAARTRGIAEALGLLEEGRVPQSCPPAEQAAEQKWAEELAKLIVSRFDEYPKINDNAILNTVAEHLGEAMGKGMSLNGSLTALSLAACQLYLRTSGGNPADVHQLTGVGARRHLLGHPNVPSRLKVLAMLAWASGFEVRASASVSVPQMWGRRRNRFFGAPNVPLHAERLLAGSEKPPMEPRALLDYISRAITVRPLGIEPAFQVAENSRTKLITHDQQMAMMYHNLLPNGGNSIVCTEEVATKVLPAVWLYDQKAGGDLDAYFARLAAHVAMDDYSEMHAQKHTALCYQECLQMPREHQWLYMAAAAKAICNHSGAGHRVYDSAAKQVPDLTAQLQARVPGWHPADGYMRRST